MNLKKSIVCLFILLAFTVSASHVSLADPPSAYKKQNTKTQRIKKKKTETPGVNSDVSASLKAKSLLNKAYDRAESEVVTLKKSFSVAALTCFNKAVESFSKGSAKIYSGDFSRQVKEPIEEGLKSHFSDYKWEDLNKIISYDASIDASFEVKVVLEAQVTTADSFTGPTIKNFSCDNMNKAWMGYRDEEFKSPPSFKETLTSIKDGVKKDASDVWKKTVDNVKNSVSGFETGIEDMEKRKDVVLAIDTPFLAKNGTTVCGTLIDVLGIKTDCNEDYIDKDKDKDQKKK